MSISSELFWVGRAVKTANSSTIRVRHLMLFPSLLYRRCIWNILTPNWVFLLNCSRLSKNQFYPRFKDILAERDRPYADESTAERTRREICEICSCQTTEKIWKHCSAEESTSVSLSRQSNSKCCHKSRGMEISF